MSIKLHLGHHLIWVYGIYRSQGDEILPCTSPNVCEKTAETMKAERTAIVNHSIVIRSPPPHHRLLPTPVSYMYTHTTTLAPTSFLVLHHLSLDGDPAHTVSCQPIRRVRAPHAHRPLTPNQLGRWSWAVSQSVHVHLHTHIYHWLIHPKHHHRQRDKPCSARPIDFYVVGDPLWFHSSPFPKALCLHFMYFAKKHPFVLTPTQNPFINTLLGYYGKGDKIWCILVL